MPANPEPAPRPTCPKCHLPIREGERSISHLGKTYHVHCAPTPESAGNKDDPYGPGPIGI